MAAHVPLELPLVVFHLLKLFVHGAFKCQLSLALRLSLRVHLHLKPLQVVDQVANFLLEPVDPRFERAVDALHQRQDVPSGLAQTQLEILPADVPASAKPTLRDHLLELLPLRALGLERPLLVGHLGEQPAQDHGQHVVRSVDAIDQRLHRRHRGHAVAAAWEGGGGGSGGGERGHRGRGGSGRGTGEGGRHRVGGGGRQRGALL